MIERVLARGLVLCAIALSFGLPAMRDGIGTLSHVGPGLFPLMASSLLLPGALLVVWQEASFVLAARHQAGQSSPAPMFISSAGTVVLKK